MATLVNFCFGKFGKAGRKAIKPILGNHRYIHEGTPSFGERSIANVSEIEDTIRRNTEISCEHLTPELRLHLLTPNCPLYHSPISGSESTTNDAVATIFKDPFWSIYWPGGQALTRFILDRREILFKTGNESLENDERKETRILDLGAGCGASAIAAKLMGAHRVIANDIDADDWRLTSSHLIVEFRSWFNRYDIIRGDLPIASTQNADAVMGMTAVNGIYNQFCIPMTVACTAIGMNAALNDVEVQTSNRNLITEPYDETFDVIFIGDLLYDEEIAEILVPWLEKALNGGSRIYLGDPGRHGLTEDLKKRLKMLERYSLPEIVRKENHGFDTATVWQFID